MIVLACFPGAPVWADIACHHGPNDQNLEGFIHQGGHRIPVVRDDGTPIGPGWRACYLLGADSNGRDLAVRILYGGRISLEVGGASALLCVALALLLGLVAGYTGGFVDAVISRFLDLIWSFPVYLLAVALATTLAVGGLAVGPLHVSSSSLFIPIVVIAVVFVPYVARPIRGQVLSLRQMEFVEAAVATGAGPIRIMVSELLPNVASITLVMLTLIVANNILTEAALSFLGVGVPVLTPSWGNIIEQGYSSIVTAPALTVAPGIAIMLTVVSLNVLGDALRDALDPHARIRIALMGAFILRRMLGLVVVLFAISLMVFVIFNVIPGGDPALRLAGRHPTQQNIRQIRKDWGFDKPLYVQYGDMMERLFIKRDLISYQDQTPVMPTIERGIPRTLSLAVGAALIWLVTGIAIGVASGVHQGRWLDRILTVLALAGVSIPIFWLGAVLLYLLTFRYHSWAVFSWIPPGGYVDFASSPLGWAEHLLLPWIVLAVVSIGFYARVVRASLLEVRSQDYVRTARAKGLRDRRVLIQHTLRNCLIPVVTLFGLDFGAAVGGTVILIEPIFGIEGVGQYAQESVAHLDLPPLMALTLYGAFFVVVVNTFVDLAYAWLDPRTRIQ